MVVSLRRALTPGREPESASVTEALRESEERYHDLFENAAEPIATADLAGVITDVNRAFAEALGYGRDELIGTTLGQHVTRAGRKRARAARDEKLAGDAQVTTYEQEFKARDGRKVTFEVATRLMHVNGQPVGIQGMCRDVTERRLAEAELRAALALNRYQARHDALTGLPNRGAFHDRVARLTERRRIEGRGAAVLLVDLDGFKEVNDNLGHHEGDRLLAELAARFRAAFRGRDLVARLGGDEFGLLLEDRDGDGRLVADQAILRISEILEAPFMLRGLPITLEGSIGVALYPGDAEVAEVLLRQADIAMYAAKAAGKAHAYFSAGMHSPSADRLTLVGELRRALERRELTVDYQPMLTAPDGAIIGVEALVRWAHPTRGLLQPGEFVPLAEQTGLIAPLTKFVLSKALEQQAAWVEQGLDLQVSVNLSARNLLDDALPGLVEETLERLGLPASRLILELTESTAMGDPGQTLGILGELSRLGVRIAMDDFGAGHTSLAHLGRLPLDRIKIDRTIVTNATQRPSDVAVLRAMIGLAHDLGLEVVAEGVESQEVWTLLHALGCDLGQGFHLGRPMSSDAIEELVRRQTPLELTRES